MRLEAFPWRARKEMLYPMSLHPFHLEPGGSSIMVVQAEPEGIHKVPTSPGLGEGGVVLALKGTSGC